MGKFSNDNSQTDRFQVNFSGKEVTVFQRPSFRLLNNDKLNQFIEKHEKFIQGIPVYTSEIVTFDESYSHQFESIKKVVGEMLNWVLQELEKQSHNPAAVQSGGITAGVFHVQRELSSLWEILSTLLQKIGRFKELVKEDRDFDDYAQCIGDLSWHCDALIKKYASEVEPLDEHFKRIDDSPFGFIGELEPDSDKKRARRRFLHEQIEMLLNDDKELLRTNNYFDSLQWSCRSILEMESSSSDHYQELSEIIQNLKSLQESPVNLVRVMILKETIRKWEAFQTKWTPLMETI